MGLSKEETLKCFPMFRGQKVIIGSVKKHGKIDVSRALQFVSSQFSERLSKRKKTTREFSENKESKEPKIIKNIIILWKQQVDIEP